jgi:hypothetical protein
VNEIEALFELSEIQPVLVEIGEPFRLIPNDDHDL